MDQNSHDFDSKIKAILDINSWHGHGQVDDDIVSLLGELHLSSNH